VIRERGEKRNTEEMPTMHVAATAMRKMYFRDRDLPAASKLLFRRLLCLRVNQSLKSIVAPMGQIYPQKTRPKKTARAKIIKAHPRRGITVREAAMVPKDRSGSSLRKRST
jgi:hypothetical protein